MDSWHCNLPDTAEFSDQKYKVKFQPDYVARPTIGYTRDNFGRGFYGGSAISLSDMLGDHNSWSSLGYINGRITEAQVRAAYVNLSNRLNWARRPEPGAVLLPRAERSWSRPQDGRTTTSASPTSGASSFDRRSSRTLLPAEPVPAVRRQHGLANVDDAYPEVIEPYDPSAGLLTGDPFTRERTRAATPPSSSRRVAYVFDNSLPGYVGPFYGTRLRVERLAGGRRLEVHRSCWRTIRRYDTLVGPVHSGHPACSTIGRIGRDADQFRLFLGNTDLVSGNTSGSYRRNECLNATDPTPIPAVRARPAGGHPDRPRQRRAPVPDPVRWPDVPARRGFPPIEGALFYDIGHGVGPDASTRQVEPRAGRRSLERPDPDARPSAPRSGRTCSAS